jgi:serine/threonine-protein kinase RsbW
MIHSILIAGSQGEPEIRLREFLEESGFEVFTTTLLPGDWVQLSQKIDLLFWIVPSHGVVGDDLSLVLPDSKKVLVFSEDCAVKTGIENIQSVIQLPWNWGELLVLLGQCFPEDAELYSEMQIGDWIDFSLGSTKAIFQSMRRFLRILLQHSPLPEDSIHAIHYAICEVLLNAMEHGNRFDSRKRVKGSYVIFKDRLVVKIDDQGSGFLPEDVPDPIEAPVAVAEERRRQGKRPGGYGLHLARKWMEMTFNDRGNSVVLSRAF